MGPTEDECMARRQSGWSISRDGIATARGALDRFIPDSPRKEACPSADPGEAVLKDDLPRTKVLDRRERQTRVGSEHDLGRPVEETLRNGLALGTVNLRA